MPLGSKSTKIRRYTQLPGNCKMVEGSKNNDEGKFISSLAEPILKEKIFFVRQETKTKRKTPCFTSVMSIKAAQRL